MKLIRLVEVDSTNRYAKNRFAELPDGALIAADRQTAGRGRCGRVWHSTPGRSVTATAVLKAVEQSWHAGCIVGLAALAAVRRAAPGIDVCFKWPNDLYAGARKLAGILSEGVLSGGRIVGVVSGIGINVNVGRDELDGVGQPATSLLVESRREHDVLQLTRFLAEALGEYYSSYRGDPGRVIDEWKRENRLIGRELEFSTPAGERFRGVFFAIGDDGAMMVELPDLSIRRFDCGDVKILL